VRNEIVQFSAYDLTSGDEAAVSGRVSVRREFASLAVSGAAKTRLENHWRLVTTPAVLLIFLPQLLCLLFILFLLLSLHPLLHLLFFKLLVPLIILASRNFDFTIDDLVCILLIKLEMVWLFDLKSAVDLSPGNGPPSIASGHLEQKRNQFYHRALDGFLMVVASDGDVLFVTDNIASFLGLTQVSVVIYLICSIDYRICSISYHICCIYCRICSIGFHICCIYCRICSIGYHIYSIDYRICSIGYRICSIGYRICSIDCRTCSIDYRLCPIRYRICSIDYLY